MHAPTSAETGSNQPAQQRCAERIARAWALAIAGTSYVSMGGLEVQDFLTGLSDRLIKAVSATSFEREVVLEVGGTLVAAHFTQPVTLDRTMIVLAEQFADAPPERVAAMQGTLAAGYAEALRDRVLDEQEEIRTAALWARARAEHARWASEARFRALFVAAAIGMGVGTVDGRIIEVNQALCEMLGYTADELRQRRMDEFIHPDDSPEVWPTYFELVDGSREHFRLEKAYFHKEGRVVWTDLVVSLIRNQNGRPRFVVAMFEDITERHELGIRLRHQALHDPLTQLPNRTMFFDGLAAVLAASSASGASASGSPSASGSGSPSEARVGLCYLGVDGFKAINDTLGHDVGDQLLCAVAQRLDQTISTEGQLVARMGGDEFVILVERSQSTAAVCAVAEAALRAVRAPVYLAGHEIRLSASAGVVERPVRGAVAAELMKAADTTLHWAKQDGKDRTAVFDPDRHAAEVVRYELSASMPAALERHEFFVEYQPLVRLHDGVVTGVEALVRWRHPRQGVLGPDRFISMAEETGLIVPLGLWVLREACGQAAAWRRERPDTAPVVNVNVAVRQMRDQRIVDDVATVLRETGLPPESLQLELTESAVMGSAGEPLEALRALANIGVRIAIDDFGTGYSNFAYLRRLPVHSLKLAGSLVAGLSTPERADPVDEQIVAAVINLAHLLHLTVTGEGVETAEQAERLRALGCDTGQGWYFGEPGAPEAIPLVATAGSS